MADDMDKVVQALEAQTEVLVSVRDEVRSLGLLVQAMADAQDERDGRRDRDPAISELVRLVDDINVSLEEISQATARESQR